MKKIFALLVMMVLMMGAAYAEPSYEMVVVWAQELAANEYVKADLEGAQWKMQEMGGHYEALASDAEGNMLFMCAFLPSGQPIYLCHMAAGDTDCLVSAEPKYERGGEEQLKFMAYALEAVQALTPIEPDPIKELELESESDIDGEKIYLNHFEAGTVGWKARRWVRIQVEPEVRVTHYVDGQYFSGDDVDRLEPGMG